MIFMPEKPRTALGPCRLASESVPRTGASPSVGFQGRFQGTFGVGGEITSPGGQAAAFGILKGGREIHVVNETQVHAQLPSSALHRGCHRRGTGDPHPARPALPGTRGPELGSSLSRGPASRTLPAPVGRGRGQLRVSRAEISPAFSHLLPHFGSIHP